MKMYTSVYDIKCCILSKHKLSQMKWKGFPTNNDTLNSLEQCTWLKNAQNSRIQKSFDAYKNTGLGSQSTMRVGLHKFSDTMSKKHVYPHNQTP
jgi:hypothetical protein